MAPPPLPPDPYANYPGIPGAPQNRAGVTASLAVWISAALLLISSTCCACVMGSMGVMPLDELKQSAGSEDIPPELWDQIGASQPYLATVGVVVTVLLVVPAVVMLVLGFGVRQGRRGPTLAALGLAIGAAIVHGALTIAWVVVMLRMGLIDVCSLGLLLLIEASLVWCILSLKKALTQIDPVYGNQAFAPMHQHGTPSQPTRPYDDDPWENSL